MSERQRTMIGLVTALALAIVALTYVLGLAGLVVGVFVSAVVVYGYSHRRPRSWIATTGVAASVAGVIVAFVLWWYLSAV